MRKHSKAFTILESLAVLSIVIIIASAMFISLRSSRNKPALEEARIVVLEALEGARSRAANGAGISDHGVHIQTDRFFIFENSTYPAPTSTERLLPSSVNTDQASTTIIFKRLTALPSATATILLTNSQGATTSIMVTETGAIIGM